MTQIRKVKNVLPIHLTWQQVYNRLLERPNETQLLIESNGGDRTLYQFDVDYAKSKLN